MELCSPEDQQKVVESMSTPAMKGVELEVVLQKPGQVVKVKDPHVVLVRGGTVRDSSNFATCQHIKSVSMERQRYLREDRRRVSTWPLLLAVVRTMGSNADWRLTLPWNLP
jgi:hypothetical protein